MVYLFPKMSSKWFSLLPSINEHNNLIIFKKIIQDLQQSNRTNLNLSFPHKEEEAIPLKYL